MSILVAGLLLGIDNLVVGSAVGLLPASRRRRVALAAAFGVAEISMTMIGLRLGVVIGELPGSLAVIVAGTLVLFASFHRHLYAEAVQRRTALVVVPLALSLDNLAAGAGLGAGRFGDAILAGLASAFVSALGLFAVAPIGRRAPLFAQSMAGCLIMVFGAMQLLQVAG